LHVGSLAYLDNFEKFEALLNRKGPWLAGLDFPFGQPTKLITNLKWPRSWAAYVRQVSFPGLADFVTLLANYRQLRPAGDKQHLRAVDEKANSRSPMMLYGVPVGRMFFQGAQRLLNAGVSVWPCYPVDDDRIVVEAYPALVARKWVATPHYKSDTRAKQTQAHHNTRKVILDGIRSEQLMEYYGLTLNLKANVAERCLADPSGDSLDAVLCAIQAAWAYQHKHQRYGIPDDCDDLEGWIVDPALLKG
jgi:Protein of unknown function (DUF429)